MGVDVKDLAPIGRIHRARRDRQLGRAVHVVPPEELRCLEVWPILSKRFPEFGASNKMIGLFPELNLGETPIIPTVADDPMLTRRLSGEIGRLHGAGNGRHLGPNIDTAMRVEKLLDIGRVLADTSATKSHHIDHRRPSHFLDET